MHMQRIGDDDLEMGFDFSSSGPGQWCLVNNDTETPWFHFTLVLENGAPLQTVLTSDMALVRQIIVKRLEGIRIKSFQALFPSTYPDNAGWGIAEIYELKEQKTKKGIIFYYLRTRFGRRRIGGPSRLMAADVHFNHEIMLYQAEPPKDAELYYSNR